MAIKTFSPEVSQQATEVIGHLNQMAEQGSEIHKAQQAELSRTNGRLYELLGNLYKQYVEVSADCDLLEAVLAEMGAALKVRGQRVQKNKPLNTFVRYVFDTDRQRTFNYKRCLQAALDQKVPASGFKVFILRVGGIEACKLKSKPKSSVQDKAKVQAAYAKVDRTLSAAALATIKLDPASVQEVAQNKYTFLLARAKPNGEVDVLAVLPKHSSSLEAWAINLIAEASPDAAEDQFTVDKPQDLISTALAQAELIPAEETA